jgi:hypothetical protein
MTTNDIIKELERLPVQKRIYVIEKALHSIRRYKDSNQMKKAADVLYDDYKTDKELTAFTDIDFKHIYLNIP